MHMLQRKPRGSRWLPPYMRNSDSRHLAMGTELGWWQLEKLQMFSLVAEMNRDCNTQLWNVNGSTWGKGAIILTYRRRK